MKILITGVSGFVGQKLAARFLDEGHYVVGVDLVAANFAFSKHSYFQFCPTDLTKTHDVQKLPMDDVDVLYHLAAAGVKASGREWSSCVYVNVVGTASLMGVLANRIAAGAKVPRLVYTKSYYEDHCELIPAFRENPYVMSKVATTRWIEAFEPVYLESITIAKVFQVYGPGDDPKNVLNYAAKTLKAGEKASFGSGKSLRDWIYIDDFISGLVACANIQGRGIHRYDLGSGERHTIREMVELIARICGKDDSLLEFDKSKDRGDAEIEDWAQLFPRWCPKTQVQAGLQLLIDSF